MVQTMKQTWLELDAVAERLGMPVAQVYSLVRHGDLMAIKLNGPGNFRVSEETVAAYLLDRDQGN
jgi:excisionase family DNA binding protein